jgi:hypothetical protein
VTKAPESGDNEITDAVRREAARTGRDVCDILREWREQAKRQRDRKRVRLIEKTEKYLKCRNRRKRRSR